MKNGLLLLGLICFLCKTSSGQDQKKFFFNEVMCSVNRTTVHDDNTNDRFGYGIGVCHTFMDDKEMNITIGFEFNHTSQFKKSMYEDHFSNCTDLTYRLNCLSIPFGLRYNFGSKTKIFIEVGVFTDLVLNSNRTGTMHSYYPDGNNQIRYVERKIDQNAGLSNTRGFHTGLGVRIPLSRFELIIKPDYKFAIGKLISYYDDMYNAYCRINVGLKF